MAHSPEGRPVPPASGSASGIVATAELGGSRKNPHFRHLPLFLALLIVLAVSLHFCLWKSGMFIDEIYTYGLANSSYMPFIGNGGQDGEHDRIEEQMLTREDFFDYLAVTEGEAKFDVGSVYYNQVQDVHPPLYYWILNFCSSIAAGHFSKWIGLIPDLIIYLGTLVLLYVLGAELFSEPWIAAMLSLFYGLSRVGLSTMLMIRMYVLVTFLTVLLALLVVRELRSPSRLRELAVAGSIFLGLFTQYYFVFYAFFLCAAAVIVLLCRKERKAACCFCLFSFAAVGLMLLSFPAVLSQITGNRLGPESDALANLKNISAWLGRLRYYFGQIREGLHWTVVASLVSLLCAGIGAAFHRKFTVQKSDFLFLVLLIPVIPTVFIPAVISPVLEGRYIYNIMPVCTLALGFCATLALRHNWGKLDARGFFLIFSVGTVMGALLTVPDYIYDEHRDYNALVQAHADAPCVYITGYYAGPTQDMLQLMAFDSVYITENPESDGLKLYLAENPDDECVVYIDVDSVWGSGFNSDEVLEELLEETDYTLTEPLYRYALSSAWLLSK